MSLTPLFINRPRAHPVPPPSLADEPPVRDTPKRLAPAIPPTDAKALAAAIVEIGGIRRGEIDRTPVPTHPLALAIVAAATKSRAAPGPPPLPTHPVALAIVLSARKARGEISTKQDAWLTDYVTTLELLR